MPSICADELATAGIVSHSIYRTISRQGRWLAHAAPALQAMLMTMQKTVLTTGDVAKLCSVAPRTVSKWFDSGKLRGYRIPGSKDRRIPVEQLVRFMRSHNIPLNGLETGQTRLLILDPDEALCTAITESLSQDDRYEVIIAPSTIEAGSKAQEMKPHVLLVDVNHSDIDPQAIIRWTRCHDEFGDIALVATGANLSEGKGQALLQAGFDAFIPKPFTIQALTDTIDRATDNTIAGTL